MFKHKSCIYFNVKPIPGIPVISSQSVKLWHYIFERLKFTCNLPKIQNTTTYLQNVSEFNRDKDLTKTTVYIYSITNYQIFWAMLQQ